MPSQREPIPSERKLELLLLVACQLVCFLAALLLISWGFSAI